LTFRGISFWTLDMKKKTSLADIAKALGVSKTLVSMVLNDKGTENGINEDTQKRVWAKAKELDYKPNMMARSLRMGRSNTIGLIVADISNSFYASVCAVPWRMPQAKQVTMCSLVAQMKTLPRNADLIQMLRDRQVDGLIISTTLSNNEDIQELKSEKFPFVLIDRFVPGQEDTPFVTADNYGGSISVVDHLIKQGHHAHWAADNFAVTLDLDHRAYARVPRCLAKTRHCL
jgi:LacI family transcriptional regulator